ncbi:MAG: hypothetical protein ACOYMY_06745 [Prochlorococcaceae cyanobacterium]
MIDLLLPWHNAASEDRAHRLAQDLATAAPWLRPQPLGVSASGPAMVLESLALAPARPLLVWCGTGPLDPTPLQPEALLARPLPAAPPAAVPGDIHWPAVAEALGFGAPADAPWVDLALVWVPDAATLAQAWQAAAATLMQLWPDAPPEQQLTAAFCLAQLRLAGGSHRPDSCHLPVVDSGIDAQLQAAIWTSDDPREALADLMALGDGDPSPDDARRARAVRAALLLREPEALNRAWQHLEAMAPDPAWWSLRLQVWQARGRPPGWQPFAGRDPHAWIAGLPQDELLLLAQVLQRRDLEPAGLLEQVQRQLHDHRPTLDAAAAAVYAVAGPGLRRPCWPWASVEAADPGRLCGLQQQVCAALVEGRGFSLVRLGDGEGLFLAGRRPCLGGATVNGRRRDGGLSAEGHLPDDEHQALIDAWLQAVIEADVVGLPDLDQCLRGPEHYPLVASGLGQALAPHQLEALGPCLLPGGCHLHLFWLASGAYEQPPFLNVHGLIAPLLPPAMANRVAWQALPGELGHHPVAEGPAHYPEVYQQTLAWIDRQAAPGRLFLVGAGLLGKLYCAAIRRRGGVAIDVGSLIDLCGDHRTSRGEFRLNPTLPALARRAFVQPTCSG